ncbi:MAG: hypothetical protein Kow0079_10560 [Vicingaceae bacterium]
MDVPDRGTPETTVIVDLAFSFINFFCFSISFSDCVLKSLMLLIKDLSTANSGCVSKISIK